MLNSHDAIRKLEDRVENPHLEDIIREINLEHEFEVVFGIDKDGIYARAFATFTDTSGHDTYYNAAQTLLSRLEYAARKERE